MMMAKLSWTGFLLSVLTIFSCWSTAHAYGHFDGLGYAYYDTTSSRTISSLTNTISMQLKTFATDGVLLMATGNNNYIVVELHAGYVRLRIRFSGTTGADYIISNGVKISDNQWHRVEFTRDRFFGSLTVDGIRSPNDYRDQGERASIIINQMIYVGGVPSNINAASNLYTLRNYTGCLRYVVFNGITILSNALSSQVNYGYVGKITNSTDCETTPEQFVAAQVRSETSSITTSWTPSSRCDYSFEFWFRTTDSGNNRELVFLDATNSIVINLKGGTVTMLLFGTLNVHNFKPKVADGSWHLLKLTASCTNIRVYVDDDSSVITFSQTLTTQQSPQITIGLKNIRSFTGCVRGIKIDNVLERVGSNKFIRSGISLNSCPIQNFCQPFFPCYNNATCTSSSTSFTCNCGTNSNYEGFYCQTYKYRRNCEEIFIANPSSPTGWYTIDPDGPHGPNLPFPTQCFADSRVTTQVSNNLEGFARVPVSSQYIGPGSFVANIIYRDGPASSIKNISIGQAAALADISQSCSQTVTYRCMKSVLLNTPNTPYGWWISRNDEKIVSWGGAPTNSLKCSCGVTNSCYNRTKMCNCDANHNSVRDDSGALTDKSRLPVKQLKFGFEDIGSNPLALYSLGKLNCRNRANPKHVITFTTRESTVQFPTWQAEFNGYIELAFRSSISNGVLLKNTGRYGSFIRLAVQPKLITLNYNLGQGGGNQVLQVKAVGNTGFDDNEWHRIRLSCALYRTSLKVDDQPEATNSSLPNYQLVRLDIDSPLVLGGDLTNGMNGYVGCIGDLYIGENLKKLDTIVAAIAGVRSGCGKACSLGPCQHNTSCTGDYLNFQCDCKNTLWTGRTCQAPKGAHFSGGNIIEYKANETLASLANGTQDISFNFVSNATTIKIFDIQTNNGQKIEFGLDNGQAYLSVNSNRSPLQGFISDEQSHQVIISPTTNSISIDGDRNVLGSIPSVLDLPTVQIGSSGNSRLTSMCVYNVSFIGIPIMAYSFSNPQNPSITSTPNSGNQGATESVCVAGNVIKTPAPTTPSIRATSLSTGASTTASSQLVGIPPGGIVGIVIGLIILMVIIAWAYIKFANKTRGKYSVNTEYGKTNAYSDATLNTVNADKNPKEWFL